MLFCLFVFLLGFLWVSNKTCSVLIKILFIWLVLKNGPNIECSSFCVSFIKPTKALSYMIQWEHLSFLFVTNQHLSLSKPDIPNHSYYIKPRPMTYIRLGYTDNHEPKKKHKQPTLINSDKNKKIITWKTFSCAAPWLSRPWFKNYLWLSFFNDCL